MRDPVMLDWYVPAQPWERFRTHVESEFGSLEGYLGREAEAAMKEYSDLDGYQGIEDRVDRLVRAAGRTPGEASEQKNNLASQETVRVTVRVDSDVKDEFSKVVDGGDDTLGVAFARAIRTYREGGRPARLERKLDRVLDDAESLLSELNEDDESGGLNKVQRNTITICDRLPEQFTDDELNSEIHDVAGRGDKASDPTLERYREAVIDRLGVVPHPQAAADVWVPESVARDYAPEGVPRECYLPVSQLDRTERVRRIKLAAARRAKKRRDGSYTVKATTIQEDVLDGEVSRSTALDLISEAEFADCFSTKRTDTGILLRVDLSEGVNADGNFDLSLLDDPDFWRDVVEYADVDTDGLLSPTTETTVDDWTDSNSPAQVSSKMDELTGAATDGGGPSRTDGDDDD